MPRAKVVGKKSDAKSKNSKSKNIVSTSKSHKKTAPAEGGSRKHRFRSGTVALREIKRYQKQITNILPRAPVQRVIREIALGIDTELRFHA